MLKIGLKHTLHNYLTSGKKKEQPTRNDSHCHHALPAYHGPEVIP